MPEYTKVFLLEAAAQKKGIAYKQGLTAFLNALETWKFPAHNDQRDKL